MNFSVVIPSRGNISKLQDIIESISKQDILAQKVYIIIDKFLSKDEFNVSKYFLSKNIDNNIFGRIELVSNINYNFCPNNGVSYVRNFGIGLVKTEYLYIIDDDNVFEKDFFKKTLSEYKYLNNKTEINKTKFEKNILCPTVMYRKTGIIQSQGIKSLNPFFGKVVLNYNKNKKFKKVKMIGGNSIFAKTEIFKKHPFDEYFNFVYEDLNFTWTLSNAGYKIYVSNELKIYHMERPKNKAEKSFIGEPNMAYQKSRNRIMLIKQNANFISKIIFYIFGLGIQTIWFLFLILFFVKEKKRYTIKSVFKGLYDGLKY
ncbi:glycosyltransferase family 2 protein [Candidatus Vampirococcus lugosii]|uniref:Glycosyltransferase, GT2 family n=1 Tax=Candidatus Vampirococcus lugosii TaxID=2789015 RepID=A0ABS5QMC3_9BACT|nr:glycosyltransferase family 2 protein [Candidatus Vampirococcus lugosii]MBS8121624.1 Glycosyltransferase, GT2 family [Candidatus Vampirococcus lugosii]